MGVLTDDFNYLEVDATVEDWFSFTGSENPLTTDDLLWAENSTRHWCLGIGDVPSSGTGPTANPAGRTAFVYTEGSSGVASEIWAMKRKISYDTTFQALTIDVLVSLALNATTDIHIEYSTEASPNETTDWTILETLVGNGGADGSWIADSWDFTGIITPNLWVRVRLDTNGSSDWHNDFGISYWQESGVSLEGVTTLSPTEFDYDESLITITGLNFEATQTTGTMYLSEYTTLAGGPEIDISAAVLTWTDTEITLDLTLLSQSTKDELDVLGPSSSLYMLILTSAANEYPYLSPLTTHRIIAVCMSESANITADGENTTAQLTAPATKTTADFEGGRIQDDENPTDSVNVKEDEYREDEFCIVLGVDSVETKVYEFRLVDSGGFGITYDVTPQLTVDVAAEAGTMIIYVIS